MWDKRVLNRPQTSRGGAGSAAGTLETLGPGSLSSSDTPPGHSLSLYPLPWRGGQSSDGILPSRGPAELRTDRADFSA